MHLEHIQLVFPTVSMQHILRVQEGTKWNTKLNLKQTTNRQVYGI